MTRRCRWWKTSSVLPTLLLLSILQSWASARPDGHSVILSEVAVEVFGGDSKCLALHLLDGHSRTGDDAELAALQQQAVVGNLSSRQQRGRYGRWLRAETWCVAALVHGADGDQLTGAVDLLRVTPRHFVLWDGGAPEAVPSWGRLKRKAQRPILWLEPAAATDKGKDVVRRSILRVQCPVTVPAATSGGRPAFVAGVWKRDRLLLKLPALCPSPVSGLELTLATTPALPNVYMSRRTGKPIGGELFNLFGVIAEHYDFRPRYLPAKALVYHPVNGTWTGTIGMIKTGRAFMVNSAWRKAYYPHMDLTTPLSELDLVFLSRRPLPVPSFDKLIRPFQASLWYTLYGTMLLLATTFWLSHDAYSMVRPDLVSPEENLVNFYLFSFAKLTEPEPLPWFNKWSSGKALVFLWTVLSTFMIMAYSCNLRAHLIAQEYERPMDTMADVLENGKKTYIFTGAVGFTREFGSKKAALLREIGRLAERTGGWYSHTEHRGLHRDVGEDLQSKRAAALIAKNILPYMYLRDRDLMARDKLHVTKEEVEKVSICFGLRKNSPALPMVNKVVLAAVQAGLVNKFGRDFLPAEQLIDSGGRASSSSQGGANVQDKLSLQAILPAFVLVAAGLLLSTVAFAAEKAGPP